jgi:hypothetical protein
MGEWTTVFADQIEGRSVEVRVYETKADEDDGDTGKPVRVIITAPGEDTRRIAEDEDDLLTRSAVSEPASRSTTIEPSALEDLEEELREVGFSPQAAARIASTAQEQPSG